MRFRAAHVISARGVGGAERFLVALVREGTRRGWDQVVLNPFAVPESQELAALVVPVAYSRHIWQGARSLPATRRWLRHELAAFGPDTVHVLLFHALVTMATIPRSPGQTRVVTNMYGEGVRLASYAALRERLDRWAGRRVDLTVAISESVRRFLLDSYGYVPSAVTCIPLGWEGQPLPHRNNGRPPTVVCVGNLRAEKGHDVLLRAFDAVHQQLPDARLVLVGDGPTRGELTRQIAARGLGDHVQITGSVTNVWTYLADADVFALASATEAYGIAVTEAMAAGLPVIASAVGGIPDLVVPGVTGELFAPGDTAALANQLLRLLGSPRLRAEMGAAGRQAATAHHLDGNVARYADAFELLASSQPSARR